jgi:hypothetical protein
MRKYRAAADGKAFAELNIGASDYFIESGLADRQRQAPQILAIQIKRAKATSTSFVDLPLSSFCRTAKTRGAIGGRHHFARSRSRPYVPCVARDLLEAFGPVIMAGKPEGRKEAFRRKAELQLAEERIRHELKIPDTP